MKQLVSILIPAFNAEKWICDSIESAIAQTWPRKEIIIVDDGSRDKTFEIARIYSSPDVKVVTQDNCGASSARNRALSLAQGDYIQWLDADDLLAPDKIARQMEGAEPGHISQILISGAWGKFYFRPERSRFEPDSLWEDLDPVEWLYRKINENLWMAIESWLVSRRLTDMAGPWNESLSRDNDGEYFCRVIFNVSKINFIPESRCLCRRGNFGISHNINLNNNKLNSLSNSLFSYIRVMRSMEDSPRTKKACLKLLNRWSIYFYPERTDLLKKMNYMAAELGGQITPPKLRPKYQMIQKIFGWRIGKKAQNTLPAIRVVLEKNWERFQCLGSARNTTHILNK